MIPYVKNLFHKHHWIFLGAIGIIVAVVEAVFLHHSNVSNETIQKIFVIFVTEVILLFLADLIVHHERISSQTKKIIESIKSAQTQQTKFYKSQVALYEDLAKVYENHSVDDAVFIQYSGYFATDLAIKLLKRGAKVTLYLHDLESSVSDVQKERIKIVTRDMRRNVGREVDQEKLTQFQKDIVRYECPGSFRAVLIDRNVLAAGWYIYENVLEHDPNFPDDQVEISGHDMPGVLCYRGSPEFDILLETFDRLIENYNKHREKKKHEPDIST